MTRVLAGDELAQRLRQQHPDAIEEQGEAALWVKPDSIVDVVTFFKEDPELRLNYLNAISAVDYIEYFELVYHLTSLEKNHGAVVKARVYGREEPTIPSVVGVWQGADFQEREIWDLMGVRFSGHPNHKRIMLWEGFLGHPLRKDFEDVVQY
jgi:NADH/F420H2 dehydrogenase subunit C